MSRIRETEGGLRRLDKPDRDYRGRLHIRDHAKVRNVNQQLQSKAQSVMNNVTSPCDIQFGLSIYVAQESVNIRKGQFIPYYVDEEICI